MDLISGVDFDQGTRFLRGLKGGRGGSSGGGSRGGSSYGGSSYSSRSGGGYYYGSNNSSGGGDMPTWAVILLLVAFGSCIVCYCIYKSKKGSGGSSSAPAPGADPDFAKAVDQARQKNSESVRNDAYVTTSGSTPDFETYEGDFDVTYVDRGNTFNGSVKMRLMKNSNNQYKIEGECSDADGSAKIVEGFSTLSGKSAYWVEETLSGTDTGLKVLTEGSLDFENNTFSGTWRANTGIRGNYTSFTGKNVSKTFSPGGGGGTVTTNLQQMLEEDIPLAEATVEVETPVVTAVPEVEPTPTAPVVSAILAPSAPPPESATSNMPQPYVPRT